MKKQEIAQYRLFNQQIATRNIRNVKDLVAHLGAIQAQDYEMAKWAIALRIADAQITTIEQAINQREIFRTHILRPTWHIVSADDIRWMLAITAPNIKRTITSMMKKLEIDEPTLVKSMDIIQQVLANQNALTRPEIMEQLSQNGIKTNDLRSSHLMMYAELESIVCNGSWKGKQLSYLLLDEVVPNKQVLEKEEALALLAKKYFMSHGPASLQDYIWWSGLTVKDAKEGLELAKSVLQSIEVEGQTYWFQDLPEMTQEHLDAIYLLPAFDEFLVSYKDRTASIEAQFHPEAMTVNGIFKPIIVKNGQTIGTWKRYIQKDKAQVETTFFEAKHAHLAEELSSPIAHFQYFFAGK